MLVYSHEGVKGASRHGGGKTVDLKRSCYGSAVMDSIPVQRSDGDSSLDGDK